MKQVLTLQQVNFPWIKEMSLSLQAGEIGVLVDVDKTTALQLIKIVAGLEDYRGTGSIRYFEERKRDGKRIGCVTGLVECQSDWSVEEQLYRWAKALKLPGEEQDIDEVIGKAGLEEFRHRKVNVLEEEEQIFLQLAASLLFHPDLLVIGDVLSRFTQVNKEKFLRKIVRLNQVYGIAVLMMTHYIDDSLNVANQIWVVRQNRLLKLENTCIQEKNRRFILLEARPLSRAAVLLEKIGVPYIVTQSNEIQIPSKTMEVSSLVESLVEENIQVDKVIAISETIQSQVKALLEYGYQRERGKPWDI